MELPDGPRQEVQFYVLPEIAQPVSDVEFLNRFNLTYPSDIQISPTSFLAEARKLEQLYAMLAPQTEPQTERTQVLHAVNFMYAEKDENSMQFPLANELALLRKGLTAGNLEYEVVPVSLPWQPAESAYITIQDVMANPIGRDPLTMDVGSRFVPRKIDPMICVINASILPDQQNKFKIFFDSSVEAADILGKPLSVSMLLANYYDDMLSPIGQSIRTSFTRWVAMLKDEPQDWPLTAALDWDRTPNQKNQPLFQLMREARGGYGRVSAFDVEGTQLPLIIPHEIETTPQLLAYIAGQSKPIRESDGHSITVGQFLQVLEWSLRNRFVEKLTTEINTIHAVVDYTSWELQRLEGRGRIPQVPKELFQRLRPLYYTWLLAGMKEYELSIWKPLTAYLSSANQ